jgi:hypothetical protein
MRLDEARAVVAGLRGDIDELITIRADLAELQADLVGRGSSPLGGLADAKALEARMYAHLEQFAAAGIEVKGLAPLLLDLLGERAGVPVLWCWLEGDPDITWYHRLDTGFLGRRPI